MKTKTKVTAFIISFALMLGMFDGNEAFAKKGAFLSSKKLTVTKGKSKTLKVKNTKTKVKWEIVSGKENIFLKKKNKQTVTIKGKKQGTAKVQATVGKKKLTCTVSINNVKKTTAPEPVTPVYPDPITPIFPDPIATIPPSPIFSQSPSTTAPPLGSHEEDVAVLKKIIAQQRAQGATVSEDLDNTDEYQWRNGRLWGIFWLRKNLSGVLDMSGLYALVFLSCSDGKLSSLDVRDNAHLESLYCDSNQLSNLGVSNNVNLESLSCSSNQLSNLDVSNNVNLESLFCSSNQLSNLDVSNNVNLESLSCSSNQLSNLDVSNNINLESLYCDSSQLGSLDVRNNVNLKRLVCEYWTIVK